MQLIADTHVHFYPCYDIRLAFGNLRHNLSSLAPGATCLAFLAERHDCNYFMEFSERAREILGEDIDISIHDNAVLFREKGHADLYLFSGRQIITRERIEILALTTNMNIQDGEPAADVIDSVLAEEGIPVISWAPGKWFFSRKKVVASILERYEPGQVLLGDTTLRPNGWLEPSLMKRAARKGFTIITGSDPLPFSGEEKVMGQYAIRFNLDFNKDNPVASLRSRFRQTGLAHDRVGRRGGPIETLFRLFHNARSKK